MLEKMKKYDETSYYDTEDIAGALLKLAEIDIDEDPEVSVELLRALSWIEAAAKNKYNHDYFRVFYNVLLKII